uniref:hypothetical protein n=1 Tax=Sphingobium sp. Sx8-8 TaxID=2933617 RepID=UPI001F5A520F
LRVFDSNGDGIFSSLDDQFSQFKVWWDKNGNGRVDEKEISSLEAVGVASIDLAGEAVNQSWEWGENITVNTGSFTRTNGTVGSFSDVALSYDTANSQNATISRAASQLSEAMASFWDGRGTAPFGKFEALAERRDNFLAVTRGGWR